MLTVNISACIDAPPEKTWETLADLESISLWSEPVVSSRCISRDKRGLGAERVCQLSNNVMITERWTSWIEGESYTYEGFNLPLVKSARNTWSLKPDNGKTLLKTYSEIVLKGGPAGRLLEPLMWVISARIGANSLAAFKYLVENGEPYKGKHSYLPRVPSSC